MALLVTTGALSTGCDDGSAPPPVGNTDPVVATTPMTAPPTSRPTHVAVWPDEYFMKDPRDANIRTRPAASAALEARDAPPLTVTSWYNSEPLDLRQLRGKVVVLHFWGGQRPASMKTIPRNLAFRNKYSPDDVVLIGIHDTNKGADIIEQTLEQFGITYPVAIDDDNQTAKAYKVILWPHYDVIDQFGILRASGLFPSKVESVVDYIIDEQREREGASP